MGVPDSRALAERRVLPSLVLGKAPGVLELHTLTEHRALPRLGR